MKTFKFIALHDWMTSLIPYGQSRNMLNDDIGFYNELSFILPTVLPNTIFRMREDTVERRHSICRLLRVDKKAIKGIYNKGFRKCVTCECIFEQRFDYCLCCGRPLRYKKRDKAYTMYDKMHDNSGY